MTTITDGQSVTLAASKPGSTVAVDCSSGAIVRIDWTAPGGISGSRTVRAVAESDIPSAGSLPDGAVFVLTCLRGTAEYTEPDANQSSVSGGWGGTHVSVTMLGDSIGSRNFSVSTGSITATGVGIANWCNAIIGAPFVLKTNLGVSGDGTQSIFSRMSAIPRRDQMVFIQAGTNDFLVRGTGESAGTVSAFVATWSGWYMTAIASLRAQGKKMVLFTIPPNNAMLTGADSRISALDQMNAFINALHNGTDIWVIDTFTPMWDNTQPTIRKFKTDSGNSDGTHPVMAGCLRVATDTTNIARLQAAFNACVPNIDIYDGFQPVRSLYSCFRSSTNGQAAVKTNGTGNLADGWRSINGAGTPTFTLDNTSTYTPSPNFVGPWAQSPTGVDEHVQVFNVSAAANLDRPQLRNPSSADMTNATFDLVGGSEAFAEIEIDVAAPVNLQHVELRYSMFFTQGTSPADQAYFAASGSVFGNAGSSADLASSTFAVPVAYRAVLRTPVIRMPENINTTVTQNSQIECNALFNGAGSAVITFARPRIWHKVAGRIC